MSKTINPVTTPPCAEPIYLDDTKAHLRISGTDEDTMLAALVAAARQYAEDVTGRAIICQTRKLYLNDFGDDEIDLPGTPLIKVSSIQYYDTAGVLQTLGTDLYDVDTDSTPGRVTLGYMDSWPSVQSIEKAVIITYVAGYATPFTANLTTNVLTWLGRTPTTGDVVRVTNSGGALPGNLSAGTDYYVIGAATNTCKLSTSSGGAEVDLSSAGTGTSFIGEVPAQLLQAIRMRAGALYLNREGQIDKATEQCVDNLLYPFRLMDF